MTRLVAVAGNSCLTIRSSVWPVIDQLADHPMCSWFKRIYEDYE